MDPGLASRAVFDAKLVDQTQGEKVYIKGEKEYEVADRKIKYVL